MNIKQFIPSLEWLPHYTTKDLRGDLGAGLTVGVMLIPQGMAYAMLAGLPPIYGLYASIVPLIIYAFLGSSRQLAVGPIAMVSLLVASGVGAIAETGGAEFISLAILLALMVGIFQLFLGLIRMGFLVNFLSQPVISGFTSAAALIIGISQLKHLLGVEISRTSSLPQLFIQTFSKIGDTHLYTLMIGIMGIAIIYILKKVNAKFKIYIPNTLIAVIFGILFVWGLGLDEAGVRITKEVPSGLPTLSAPIFEWKYIQQLIPTALTISLIGFVSAIAIAKAIQNKHKTYKVNPNQELISLGLANIAGSFFQAYPTTGGLSRTAVNDQAGARTGMASVISALLIILTLLFLTPLFYYLPKTILASIILVAAFGLIDYKEAIHLWRSDRRDFWMLIITFISTLTLGIEQGIGLGVLLSLVLIIYQTTRPHFAVLGKIPGSNHYRNIKRFADLEQRTDALIIRFDAQLYFANASFFKEKMEKLIRVAGNDLKVLILDAQSITAIDSSAMHILEELIDELKEKGINFYICDLKGPVRDALKRSAITEKIGEDHFFISVQNAVNYLDRKAHSNNRKYVLQTNLNKT